MNLLLNYVTLSLVTQYRHKFSVLAFGAWIITAFALIFAQQSFASHAHEHSHDHDAPDQSICFVCVSAVSDDDEFSPDPLDAGPNAEISATGFPVFGLGGFNRPDANSFVSNSHCFSYARAPPA